MIPDAKWLDALSLPARVTGGITGACILLLLLDNVGVLPLSVFGAIAWHIVLASGVFFGCLFTGSIVDLAVKQWQIVAKPRRLAAERQAIRDEKATERKEREEQVLRRLDYLSEEEIHYVAASLSSNSQSFQTWVNSSGVASLIGKGLVYSTGTQHHRDHYPFSFYDFAWDAIVARRDEFIEKDKTLKATKGVRR
ncbi:hypothetical protein ACCS81_07465 [Rhizobium ruizarguesonis]